MQQSIPGLDPVEEGAALLCEVGYLFLRAGLDADLLGMHGCVPSLRVVTVPRETALSVVWRPRSPATGWRARPLPSAPPARPRAGPNQPGCVPPLSATPRLRPS